MGVSPMQSLWVSVFYVLSFKASSIDLSDLSRYFDCDIVKIIPYIKDFEELSEKKIISPKGRSQYENNPAFEYIIRKETIEKIKKGERLETDVKGKKIESTFDFLELFSDSLDNSKNPNTGFNEMLMRALRITEEHKALSFINKTRNLLEDFEDLHMFYLICWETIIGREYSSLNDILKKLYESKSCQFRQLQNIINKNNDLIKLNLIEIKPERFYVDVNVSLTEKSLSLLEQEGVKLLDMSYDKKDFIEPKDIKKKKLLFNEPEQKQYNLIESSLKQSEFKKIQARLESKGLPKGVTVLLHGHPGTGKTETVFQMAKATGRPLLKVDISETKSAWFGESQKIIKQIFTKYKRLMKKSKLCPILFINEADALFSKRKDADFSNVSQTENEIQNILLEEMEKFEGILFATTNCIVLKMVD
jgi:hypothetical protein